MLQAVQFTQLIIVAPLLLRAFSPLETAAWYLFASINFVGSVVIIRVMLTFARLIACEVAGRELDKLDFDTWARLGRIVSTLGGFQIVLSLSNLILGAVIGFLSIAPLVDAGQDAHAVWIAFGVYLLGSMCFFIVSRYSSILMGFDRVAMSNHFSLYALLGGVIATVIALLVCPNIIIVTVCQQIAIVLGALFARGSVKRLVASGSLAVDRVCFYPEVVRQVTSPIWKSLIVQVASMGMLPLCALLIAGSGDVALAAAFGLSSRLLTAIDQASMVPLNSIQPRISGLLARGERAAAGYLIINRARIAILLFLFSISFLGLGFPWMLRSIGAKLHPLPISLWLSLALLVSLNRFYMVCLTPWYSQNIILFWRENILAGGMVGIIFWVFLPIFAPANVVLMACAAVLLAMRSGPLVAWVEATGISMRELLRRSFALSFC